MAKVKSVGIKSTNEIFLGERFGILTVEKIEMKEYHSGSPHKRKYCYCKCDCGTERWIQASSLVRTRGRTKSCGCLNSHFDVGYITDPETGKHKRVSFKKKAELHIGKKYNRLTVLDVFKDDKKIHRTVCRCDCGRMKQVRLAHLVHNNVRSCGCLRVEKNIPNLYNKKILLKTNSQPYVHKFTKWCEVFNLDPYQTALKVLLDKETYLQAFELDTVAGLKKLATYAEELKAIYA